MNIFEEVEEYVQNATEIQRMETVRYFSSKYQLTYDLYMEVLKSLEEIAQADHFITIEEHSMMYYIRLKFRSHRHQLVYSGDDQPFFLNKL